MFLPDILVLFLKSINMYVSFRPVDFPSPYLKLTAQHIWNLAISYL